MTLDKILVIGRDARTQQWMQSYAEHLFAADTAEDAWQLLDSAEPDLVVADARYLEDQARAFLNRVVAESNRIPVVVLAAEDEAEEYLQQGAAGCIAGPDETPAFETVLRRITGTNIDTPVQDARFFVEECPSSVSIVGRSEATSLTLKMIRTVARSTCNPVLIIGETGTGKELAARAVHILRHGAGSRFVALNCAALTASLLESELFGHVKGSFTSADRDKTGLLELAGDGTIFLDEISEMPLDLQAKLLRVVQEKTFRKVGGTQDIECRATIIASSNRNLYEAVEENKFRRDLYYRLAICPIIISPLRVKARRSDILLLAEYFLETSTICPDKTGKIKGLTKLAQEALLNHAWPGNVRELRNVIDRAILLETGDKICSGSLIINPESHMNPEAEPPKVGLRDFSLERAERELVARALQEAGWQKTRAAALLGITRATLYAKVKQYNITEPNKKAQTVKS